MVCSSPGSCSGRDSCGANFVFRTEKSGGDGGRDKSSLGHGGARGVDLGHKVALLFQH